MGTSNWQNIPYCVEILMKIAPKRVLDVGVGFGRWGMIVREFCDVWFQRVFPDQWGVHLEGIEAFPKSISDYHRAFYNRIHIGDAADLVGRQPGPWDVTIYGDVLEHFTKPVALRLIETSLAHSAYVLLNIPLGEEHPQEDAYGNEYERHRSSWEAEEFAAFPLIRKAFFHDYCGRRFGTFCFSMHDPQGVAQALFSRSENGTGETCGPLPEEMEETLDRLAELRGELDYIKKSPAFKATLRMRSSGAWNALRWLRNRNQAVVTIQALGAHGEASRGTEVWLLAAHPNATEPPVPWEFIERDRSWAVQHERKCPHGRCLVGSAGRLRVPVDKDPKLRFMTHAWSGRVKVAFKGRSQVVDLYSPESGDVVVFPAREPMTDRPAVSTQELTAAPSEPTSAAFTSSERNEIDSIRSDGAQALAVFCPRWLGITRSTQALFKHTYPVPATADIDPMSLGTEALNRHAEFLLATGVETVIISGGDHSHLRLARLLKQRRPGLHIKLLWHGSHLHCGEDYVWEVFQQWIEAARAGSIDCIGTVKKGMDRFLQARGVRSQFVLNCVPDQPRPAPAIGVPGTHLGIWISGHNPMKAPYAMLAAAAMIPDCRLHTAGLGERAREVIEFSNINVARSWPAPLPKKELLDAIRHTHLTLYVTLSECCPMLPLESLSVGVPCLIGPTSHLFEDNEYLFKRLVVPFPERADVIADYIASALAERDRIAEAYARYAPTYNEAARRSVKEFLA